MGSKISEPILQAIDTLVDAKLSKLKYDKTVEGTIVEVLNLEEGKYSVRYQDQILPVYSTDSSKTFNPGDGVYITIPEGDLSNKKMIYSKTSSSSVSATTISNLQNSVFEISPTWDMVLKDPASSDPAYNKNGKYGVIAGAANAGVVAHSVATIYQAAASSSQVLFQQYANKFDHIRIRASFLTQFHSSFSSGNYGVRVTFNGEDGPTLALDVSGFVGSLYNYITYSPQSVIYTVPAGTLTSVYSIELFEEMPRYDYQYGFNEQNEYGPINNKTNPNIFCKDIEIQFVDQQDLSQTDYYLKINAINGVYFSNALGLPFLDLTGVLLHQGKDLLSREDSYTCQWYERDPDFSIKPGDEGYNKNIGVGWKPIVGQTSKTITVSPSGLYQEDYKLFVVYQNSVLAIAQITVYDLDRQAFTFELEQVGNTYLRIKDADQEHTANWYIIYSDGRQETIAEGPTQIEIAPYLNITGATIYCHAFKNETSLGVKTFQLKPMNELLGPAADFTGQDVFNYDANGDINPLVWEVQYRLSTTITWPEGFGIGATIAWCMKGEDGNLVELGTSESSPYNSMIDKIHLVVDQSEKFVQYTVRKKFRISNTNNSIYLKVTADGEEYLFRKDLIFLKDGDQGTNGTSFVAVIENQGTAADPSFKFLDYAGQDFQGQPLKLVCHVYKDGEEISSSNNYPINFNWSVNENIQIIQSDGNECWINGVDHTMEYTDTESSKFEFYVKVKVDITREDLSIYSSLPIDVLYHWDSPPDISGLFPSYIKYSTSGVNPQPPSRTIVCPEHIILESKNTNLLTVTAVQGEANTYRLSPTASFIYEKENTNDSNIGVLLYYNEESVSNGEPQSFIIHPVIMYLDTYGNEAINGWDGTSIETEDGHIFAPQIGAGEKDSSNKFTGVVMGKDSQQNMIGLYGYQEGINTFGLMQNGKAFFGAKAGGGQIVLDGRHATIFGGDVKVSDSGRISLAENGMYISLRGQENTIYDKGTIANRKNYICEEYYKQEVEGQEDLQTVMVSVTRMTNEVKNVSYISEFVENNTRYTYFNFTDGSSYTPSIDVTNNNQGYVKFLYVRFRIVSTNISWTTHTSYEGVKAIGIGYNNEAREENFYVDYSGKMVANNAVIRGSIFANSGTIGGWTINSDSISSSGTILGSNGNVTLHNVTLSGSINWSGVTSGEPLFTETIAKQIAAGEYQGSFINEKAIYGPTIYANDFIVMPNSPSSYAGSYQIHGRWSGSSTLYNFFEISYNGANTPTVYISSPDGASIYWNDSIRFTENVSILNGAVEFYKGGTADLIDFNVEGILLQYGNIGAGSYGYSDPSKAASTHYGTNGHIYFMLLE